MRPTNLSFLNVGEKILNSHTFAGIPPTKILLGIKVPNFGCPGVNGVPAVGEVSPEEVCQKKYTFFFKCSGEGHYYSKFHKYK